MARTTAEVNSFIVANLVTNFATIGVTIDPTQWSKRNIMRMICYTVAVCQAYMEQLQDVYQAVLEAIYNKSAAASNLWIQAQMLLFQYSATNPQVLQLINTVIGYPVVDPTLFIITACSVTTSISNNVLIKVATGNPFVSLSADQLNAAQAYANIKFTAGIVYTVTSGDADRIYIQANVEYSGLYSAVIQTSVIAAINAFFQNISVTNFNGAIQMSDLEGIIRGVPGVTDVTLVNVFGRSATVAFGMGSSMIVNSQTLNRLYLPTAGYCISEDTTGKTLADSLIFIPQ